MQSSFPLKDGQRMVIIHVDDDDYEVTVRAASGEKVGGMKFSLIELEGPPWQVLKLTWAYLDEAGPEYKFNGIGRACLRFVREASGMEIIAGEDTGLRQDDGSHPTGDAPTFSDRMRKEGLIGR